MTKQKVVLMLFESYLSMIKNSVGSKMFQTIIAKVDGKETDITEGGRLSCAFFVSSVLANFGLISAPHATADSTVKDLERTGWQTIKYPRVGCVLVWEPMVQGRGGMHKHIGFFVGKQQAISHRREKKTPVKHHWLYGFKNGQPKRKVELMLWHKKLNK